MLNKKNIFKDQHIDRIKNIMKQTKNLNFPTTIVIMFFVHCD